MGRTVDALYMRRMLDTANVDEEVWRTTEEGEHFKFESETGEIKAGFGGRLNGQIIKPKSSKAQSNQEAVSKPSVRKQEFTPAKDISEAEEFAKRFLQSQNYGSVSYKGIGLEYANTCNRLLNDIFGEYSPQWMLGKIAPMNAREKIFKSIIDSSEACYQWGGDGALYINPRFYKDAKTLNAHKAQIDDLMKTCLEGGQALIDSGKVTGAKKDYVEALLQTRRQCVSQSYDFVEGTIVHEIGHMLDDKLFRKTMKAIDSPLAKYGGISESIAKYGKGISGYAVSSGQEYIAESFTAWYYGETKKLDPELVRVFEEAKKNGR